MPKYLLDRDTSKACQRDCAGVTAAILAGGLGARLRPALKDTPKVLARIGHRPFIAILLDQLAAAGVRKAVLLTGYRADQVRRTLGDRHVGMVLRYSVESAPLGTAGALRHALSKLETETLLLLNGDSFCDVDLSWLVAEHRRRRADLTLTLAHAPDRGRFGKVTMAADGKVTHFGEKQIDAGPGWINAGIYVLHRSLVNDIPPDKPSSLERDLLPRWVETRRCYAFKEEGRFLDIGTPGAYAAAASFFGESENEK
ncbi:MAG TPA: nucleotidyltransferase family protein [Gemmataceae bacterium]|jgi:D-glycero-alpha-D-manno-heptose 1-phosphate guanylyltransferase|nr:nucleotidyltransferase family protein [Gemmataceae bacterium]